MTCIDLMETVNAGGHDGMPHGCGRGSLWHSTELKSKGYLAFGPMNELSELHQAGPMSYISAVLREIVRR